MTYTLIIPTLNAENYLRPLLEAIQVQSCPPTRILIVDSQSEDNSFAVAAAIPGTEVLQINRNEFDHGRTRDWLVRICNTPFVVMMTQDALPADRYCMERLLSGFRDPRVAAATARQIPRSDASPRERAVRAYRYPAQSRIWEKRDAVQLGMLAYQISDVCAAYRLSAYEAVGGFKYPISTNEDMLIASDFLQAGWKLAYCGDACVLHSHNYTLRQEYHRYYQIGQFLARYGDRFPKEIAEGLQMVKVVSTELLKHKRFGSCFAFWADCAVRYIGNRAGKRSYRKGPVDGGEIPG